MSKNRIDTNLVWLIFSILIFGSTYMITKTLLVNVGPFAILVIRFVLAFAVMFPFAYREGFRFSLLRDWRIIVLGLSGVGVSYVLQNVGMKYTSAGNASLLMASIPALTAFFSYFLVGERLGVYKIMGILLSIGGIVLVTLSGKEDFGGSSMIGDLMLLGGAVFWSAYNALMKRFNLAVTPLVLTISVFGIAIIFSLPFFIWEVSMIGLPRPNFVDILDLVYLGVFASFVAYYLFNRALKNMDATVVANYVNLAPLVGLAIAAIGGETIYITQIIGGLVAIGGVWLCQVKKA